MALEIAVSDKGYSFMLCSFSPIMYNNIYLYTNVEVKRKNLGPPEPTP